jgi:uncharacterized protein involved in oxidation of intracellular sulfur
MKILLVLNDAPYGIERTYNALRVGGALAKRNGVELKLFLMGDAAAAARSGQKVPAGYYNTEIMLAGPVRRGATVGVCGTCMDARGIGETELVEGTRRSTLEELADWTLWADKVLVF